MHEQLYISNDRALRTLLFVNGLCLLPFAFLNLTLRNGVSELSFCFDFALLAASVGLSLLFILPFKQKTRCLILPHLALLVCQFLRFGTVTLLDREIPFDFYISSALFMAAAFGNSFIVFFVCEGKIRSKIALFVFPGLMVLLALCSLIFSIPPFFVLEEINKGAHCLGITRAVSFILYNLSPVLLALFLKDDKIKKEKEEIKQSKSAQ